MVEGMPTKAGGPRARLLGLAAVILTVVSIACGQGNSPTSAAAGACHVVCSDFSTSAYVAIAVSPSSLVCATAANQPTAEAAKVRAVTACGQSDCMPVVWGRDGVAALAEGQAAYGGGWAADAASTADARAIAACEGHAP